MKLFISTDLNTGTSGDIVASRELEFLKSFDDSKAYIGKSIQDTLILDFNAIHPLANNLLDWPFFIDALTLYRLSQIDLLKISIAHFYGGCYPQSIKYLKSKGVKTTITNMMHNHQISIQEHETIFGKGTFPFKHINDEKLYQMYIEGVREADIVITGGSAPKENLLKEGAKHVVVIPHGISIPLEKDIKNFPSEFRAGYLGACGPDKGLIYLIKAWSSLNYKDSILSFAGKCSENLEPLIKKFANSGKFNLAGFVKNVADFYNGISVYIQPSSTEGFGLESLEALSYGRPVIVSSGAGSADCIDDNINGFVVPAMDYTAIAEKINWLKNNPDKIKEMGKAATKKALNYDWNIIRLKYLDLWETLI